MGEKHLGRPGVCFLSTCSPARCVAWAFVAKNLWLPDSASLWRRDLKVSANLEREDFVDLAVTWHRRCFACRTVDVQRMAPAFTQWLAAMLRKVAKQVDSLHPSATIKGSRMTSLP